MSSQFQLINKAKKDYFKSERVTLNSRRLYENRHFNLNILAGCSGNGAKEFFWTAKFEKIQNNKEHAIKLYEEIVKKYLENDYAKKAQRWLSELKGNRGTSSGKA